MQIPIRPEHGHHGRLQELERDAIEHTKFFLMGDEGFWLMLRIRSIQPPELRAGESFGVFGSHEGMVQFHDGLAARLKLMRTMAPVRLRTALSINNLLADSAARMREHLGQARALTQQLQKAVDTHNGKFGTPPG